MSPATLDVRPFACPITYVRTKLKLDTLAAGDRLEVRLRGEEPARNLPRSAREDGHRVISLEPDGEGGFRLLLEKGAAQEVAWPRS
jgi:TusA-related sulfurtransferase